jgi:tetratricopeptide (TPR) repeat protein
VAKSGQKRPDGRRRQSERISGGDKVSGYILCQTKRAKLPYFIENISTNVYSIEELCYYLYHNLYLIDQTIMNEGLCSWIQEELELPALAAKLRSKISKFASAEDIVYPVFKEINYLTYEELKELNVRLQKMNEETPAMREKQKADALMENEMYVHAIQVYQNLLEREDLEEIREGMTEKVYHNLGCAYSYLFQMEKATEYFRKAYEGSRSREALEAYLIAFGMTRTSSEYEKMAKSIGTEKEVLQNIRERLQEFSKTPELVVNKTNMDEILTRLTREYHRSTGS